MDTDLQATLLEMVRRDNETREQLVREGRIYRIYDEITPKEDSLQKILKHINKRPVPGHVTSDG